MSWEVQWVTTAENELANLWLTARDANAVTAAANRLDKRLAQDPYAGSESRADDNRVTFEKPLGIDFRVFPKDRLVKVFRVWHFD